MIDESIDIMRWALAIHDPDKWCQAGAAADTLIELNDFEFKVFFSTFSSAFLFNIFG